MKILLGPLVRLALVKNFSEKLLAGYFLCWAIFGIWKSSTINPPSSGIEWQVFQLIGCVVLSAVAGFVILAVVAGLVVCLGWIFGAFDK